MILGKELYACPICFAHLVGSPDSEMLHAKHPVDVLMSSGSSFAERVERGAGVCFTSLSDVVDHVCFEHKLPQARSRRFSSLFSRFRVRATDGLAQMHVYACGGRVGHDVNVSWDDKYDNFHAYRDCYGIIGLVCTGLKHSPYRQPAHKAASERAVELWEALTDSRGYGESSASSASSSFSSSSFSSSSSSSSSSSTESEPYGDEGKRDGAVFYHMLDQAARLLAEEASEMDDDDVAARAPLEEESDEDAEEERRCVAMQKRARTVVLGD